MGNEQAARDTLAALLADGAWETLTAVQNDCWGCLPKALFHYKPNAAWADAYAYLAALIP